MEEDGSLYYTKEDITSGIGTKSQACKIKLLPVGNIPLLLFPHDASTKTIEYGGDAVPIYASTDDDGHKYYSCKHVIQKADEKKGRKTLRCGTVFIDSNSVNIGSIKSHCIKHWRVTSKKFAAPNKSSRLLSFGGFTRVNKKQKTAAAPTATAPSAGGIIGDYAGGIQCGNACGIVKL
jgi:hypothetical protein